ncbi:MAG: hypothetical protein R3A48_14315 [Polyangiales bacterium]
MRPQVPAAYVGGSGGGSIGAAAAADLAANTTFQPGSGGGSGSADYLSRPAFGGTSVRAAAAARCASGRSPRST